MATRLETLSDPIGWPMRLGGPVRPSTGSCAGRDLAAQLHRPAHPHRRPLRAGPARRAPPRRRQEAGPYPTGGGWKITGRDGKPGRRQRQTDWFRLLHVAVDDHSRVAFVQALADEKGPTCASFWTTPPSSSMADGVRIERVMTDNALNYLTLEGLLGHAERSASPIGEREPTGLRPTAKPSGSTGPCSKNLPTSTSSTSMRPDSPPSGPGSTPTMLHDPTRPSGADPAQASRSTTLTGITSRGR